RKAAVPHTDGPKFGGLLQADPLVYLATDLRCALRRRHGNGNDHAGGAEGAGGTDGGAHRSAGGHAIVDQEDGAALEVQGAASAVGSHAALEFLAFPAFDGLDHLRAHSQGPGGLLLDPDGAAFGDGAEAEFGPHSGAELARHEDVQRCAQPFAHGKGDLHPAAWQGEDDHVLTRPALESLRQPLAGLRPVTNNAHAYATYTRGRRRFLAWTALDM